MSLTRLLLAPNLKKCDRPPAVVTGASAGIGVAFAELLASRGYDVVLVARRRDRLQTLADQLQRKFEIRADVICADLTDASALVEVEAVAKNEESLALLVNNAGFCGYRPFATLDVGVIDELVDVHVRAVARPTRAALPDVSAQPF